MKVSVRVTPVNGNYEASLVDHAFIRCLAPTREAALDALKRRIDTSLQTTAAEPSEVVEIEIASIHPVLATAGILKYDPTVEDFLAETYRERDRQRIAEHGE